MTVRYDFVDQSDRLKKTNTIRNCHQNMDNSLKSGFRTNIHENPCCFCLAPRVRDAIDGRHGDRAGPEGDEGAVAAAATGVPAQAILHTGRGGLGTQVQQVFPASAPHNG